MEQIEVTLRCNDPEEIRWIGKLLSKRKQISPRKNQQAEWRESLVTALRDVKDKQVRFDLSEILLALIIDEKMVD